MDGVVRPNGVPVWLTALAQFFRDVGFPAAVAVFVLWRVDVTLGSLLAAQHRTNELLIAMARKGCALDLERGSRAGGRPFLEVAGLAVPPIGGVEGDGLVVELVSEDRRAELVAELLRAEAVGGVDSPVRSFRLPWLHHPRFGDLSWRIAAALEPPGSTQADGLGVRYPP